MTDPLSITASVVGITTAAIQSVNFLYTTIGNIKDVPTALGIKNTKADNNSRAVAGLINTPGEVRNIRQNISDTYAGGGSFAGAGIVHGLDLSISNSRNK